MSIRPRVGVFRNVLAAVPPRARRTAAAVFFLAILLKLACPDPYPEVATVEIVPPIVHAQPGVKFELEAVARAADRTPLAKSYRVRWSGSVSFASRTANPATVTGPAHNVTNIRAEINGISSRPASVIVRADPGVGDVADRLKLPHDGGPVTAVLLDAMPGTAVGCESGNDLTYAVAGSAVLNRNLREGCPNAVAVFARDRAVLFLCERQADDTRCSNDLSGLWSEAADENSWTLTNPPVDIGIVFWFRVGLPDSESVRRASEDIAYATSVYREQRAGMKFNMVPNPGTAHGPEKMFTDETCSAAEREQMGVAVWPRVVNVVYVAEVDFPNDDDPYGGYTCPPRSDDDPPLVIVAWKTRSSTLAHELGHVMGLTNPPFTDWTDGHAPMLSEEFDATNLMWAGSNIYSDRYHLSLGQILRLHVDPRSWANRGSLRSGDTQDCQPERDKGTPCPRLALDLRNMGMP